MNLKTAPILKTFGRCAAALVVVAACSSACRAETGSAGATDKTLWGYVDGSGVAHVATEQVDSRYSVVLGDATTSAARVPGKSATTAGLLTWLDISPEVSAVQGLLRDAAEKTGVDVELLKAVIAVESGFNARAVSPRGAIGLMQLMPGTADRYAANGERSTPAKKRLLDARTNILTGARMLADLTRRFGRIDLALAAWNAGEGTVRRAGNTMPAINETQAHVQLVLELYWSLLQQGMPAKAQAMLVQHAPGG